MVLRSINRNKNSSNIKKQPWPRPFQFHFIRRNFGEQQRKLLFSMAPPLNSSADLIAVVLSQTFMYCIFVSIWIPEFCFSFYLKHNQHEYLIFICRFIGRRNTVHAFLPPAHQLFLDSKKGIVQKKFGLTQEAAPLFSSHVSSCVFTARREKIIMNARKRPKACGWSLLLRVNHKANISPLGQMSFYRSAEPPGYGIEQALYPEVAPEKHVSGQWGCCFFFLLSLSYAHDKILNASPHGCLCLFELMTGV